MEPQAQQPLTVITRPGSVGCQVACFGIGRGKFLSRTQPHKRPTQRKELNNTTHCSPGSRTPSMPRPSNAAPWAHLGAIRSARGPWNNIPGFLMASDSKIGSSSWGCSRPNATLLRMNSYHFGQGYNLVYRLRFLSRRIPGLATKMLSSRGDEATPQQYTSPTQRHTRTCHWSIGFAARVSLYQLYVLDGGQWRNGPLPQSGTEG